MRYDYKALNREGKTVTGILDADEERSAIRELRRDGLTPVSVSSRQGDSPGARRLRPPKPDEVLLMLHQLATLLRSGVSLDESVASLADAQGQVFLAAELTAISARLRRGMGFSEALRESAISVPTYMYHLAKAGELTGNLAGALADGVVQMEYERTIRNELRNALVYPIILIVSGIGAVMLIFVLVVPKFSTMLAKSDGNVPLLARVVLETGQFVNDNMTMMLAVLVGLGIGGFVLMSKPEGRQKVWDGMTRAPILGAWLLESDIGRWSSMLSTLLASRVELTRALELAQQGVSSSRLKTNFSQVTKAVRRGSSLADALRESDAVTSTGYGLVKVGERSGDLPNMLKSLALMYAESGRNRMKQFLALLEPIAILAIGGVIGLIMTGIILAITSVNDISL